MQNDSTTPSQSIPCLKEGLQFTVHGAGDEVWYCVYDPWTKRYCRLGLREYVIACQLNGRQTPASLTDQINNSQDTVSLVGDPSVTEDEVNRLCQWLAKSDLLDTNFTANKPAALSTPPFNPLYIKLTLIAGHHVERLAGVLKPVVNVTSCVAITLLGLVALGAAAANWSTLSSTLSGLFVFESYWWWIVAWLLLKSVHELGHSLVAVKIGAPIRSAGISLIYFAPIPFVDVSDVWAVANRWQRIACSAAGMLAEFALASAAIILAVITEQDSIRYLCCAVAMLGTVSTLVFNANPLMRFDGYFIISDLIKRPNLWMMASQAAKDFVSCLMSFNFGSQPHPISLPLALYGMACWFYRTSILLSLAITAILVWNSLGVAIVLWGAYALFVAPWLKKRAAARLSAQPMAAPSRKVWIGRVGLATALIAVPWLIPSPVQPLSPGVVQFHQPWTIHAEAEGILTEIAVVAGQRVRSGQMLAVLTDEQLQLDYRLKQLEVQASREAIQYRQSRGEIAVSQAEHARLVSLEEQLRQLDEKLSRLTVRAPHAGVLASLPVQREIGRKISKGELICVLADPEQLEVKVSLAQRDLSQAQRIVGHQATGRVVTGRKISGTMLAVDPRGTEYLSEPLLAACYAGPLCVMQNPDSDDAKNTFRLLQPRFEARLQLPASEELAPGQLAWIRLYDQQQSIGSALVAWLSQRWQLLRYQLEMTADG